MKKKLIEHIASLIAARQNCLNGDNLEWAYRHGDKLREIEKNHLVSGSGFDSGCEIIEDLSTQDKIIIKTSFHHMNEDGFYTHWTKHKITITPSFIGGIDTKVSGKNDNDIKEYIHETLHYDLTREVEL